MLLFFACAAPPADAPPADAPPADAPADRPVALTPRLAPDTISAALLTPAPPGERAWLRTDRPLYRPGELVWVRLWRLVTATLLPAPAAAVNLTLDAPSAMQTTSLRLPPGLSTAAFLLPADATPGTWSVLAVGAQGRIATTDLIVDRPQALPYHVDVVVPEAPVKPGDSVRASVTVLGAGGELVPGVTVRGEAGVGLASALEATAVTDAAGVATLLLALPTELAAASGQLRIRVDQGGGETPIERRFLIRQPAQALVVSPEGGPLVAGFPGRIFFALTTQDGLPVNAAGQVVDDLGATVAPVHAAQRGLGSVTFQPEAGRTYALQLGGQSAPIEVAPAGCVLTAFDPRSVAAPVVTTLRCTTPGPRYLRATVRGVPRDVAKVDVGAAGATVALETGGGPATVEAFDAEGALLLRRVVGVRGPKLSLWITENSDGSIDVLSDILPTPVPAELTVSVVAEAADAWADSGRADLRAGLLLAPELVQLLPNPSGILDSPALDLALGVWGASWFHTQAADPPAAALAAHNPPALPTLGPLRHAPASPVGAPAPGSYWAGFPGFLEDFNPPAHPDTEQVDISVGAGTLEPAAVDTALTRLRSQLLYCYQRDRIEAPTLAGELTLQVRVGPDGTAEDVAVLRSTFQNTRTDRCVVGRLFRATLPPGAGTYTTTLRYSASGPPNPSRPTPPDTWDRPFEISGPETQLWQALTTDSTGHAHLALPALPPGRWRVRVEGVGGGAVGSTVRTIVR